MWTRYNVIDLLGNSEKKVGDFVEFVDDKVSTPIYIIIGRINSKKILAKNTPNGENEPILAREPLH